MKLRALHWIVRGRDEFRPGEIFELDEHAEIERLVGRGAAEYADFEPVIGPDLDALSWDELKKLAKRSGVSISKKNREAITEELRRVLEK